MAVTEADDGALVELFFRRGWRLEHEKPTRFRFDPARPTLEGMTTTDGTQVWCNPRLAAAAEATIGADRAPLGPPPAWLLALQRGGRG